MAPLKKLPRSRLGHAAIVAVFASCLAATAVSATDLRGRVQAKSASALTIELRSPNPPHEAVRKAVTDREGRYYLSDVPPGRYELVVKGAKFPISVEQVAIQELPPIRLES